MNNLKWDFRALPGMSFKTKLIYKKISKDFAIVKVKTSEVNRRKSSPSL